MANKIGRNDPCPCGSGKKYKKCCINRKSMPSIRDKHYFQLKGKDAENAVYDLSVNSFLTDWCYLNPKLPNGKELCDLLIVFGDIAIIWQIKNTKLDEDGDYSKDAIEKNLKQLGGAYRQLTELDTPIVLQNPRRGQELFDRKCVEKIYLISCLMGEEGFSLNPDVQVRGRFVHMFTRSFTEIALNELDTISDFIRYLDEKEQLFAQQKSIILEGGEEELLGHYIFHGRGFDNFRDYDHIHLTEGIYSKIITEDIYLKKKREDLISYFIWDDMINAAHTSGSPEYEICAREMARPNRFARRILSKSFHEMHSSANNASTEDMPLRTMVLNGVTYVFMFVHQSKLNKARNEMLANACLVARMLNHSKKVVGIATESKIMPHCTFSFCFLEIDEMSDEQIRLAKEIQEFLGIMKGDFQKTGTIFEFDIRDKST